MFTSNAEQIKQNICRNQLDKEFIRSDSLTFSFPNYLELAAPEGISLPFSKAHRPVDFFQA